MAAVNTELLRREYNAMERSREPGRFMPLVRDMLNGPHAPSDFSLRELYEEFVPEGRSEIRAWQRNQPTEIRESAVRTALFKNITGQLVINETLQGYNDVQFIGDQLVTVRPSTLLDGEKIPGVTRIGDASEDIGEGQPYGSAAMTEDWVQTPEMKKRGTKIGVTKELVIADKTGQLLDRCRDVGFGVRYNREIRILDLVLGLTPSVYRRRNRAAVDVYGDKSGDHDFDNLLATNALVDYTDIENAELQFEELTDPNTGILISVVPNTVIVPTALRRRAEVVTGQRTMVQFVDNQANAGTLRMQTDSNLMQTNYRVLSSPLVKQRTSSSSTWFIGDPKRAFRYMQAWGLTVIAAPASHPDDFDRDVVAQWKASEMGVAVVVDPRYMLKCTA